MPYYIGIDVGTTGAKTLLINDAGEVLASAAPEYPLHTPRPQWAEQDPADWWAATCEACRAVLTRAGVSKDEVAGVGLSGQMHGSVFLDAEHRVIRPAILWCDQRTGKQCEWITETVGENVVIEETCNPVLTGFTAPKIVWLRDNEPENFGRVRKILLPKDYIRFKLTNDFATEVSDASGTSLLNVRRRAWSARMVEGIGLSLDMLPRVVESPEVTGKITPEAAEECGLAPGTPVVGGGGDQAAGGVGNGIVEPGLVSSTVGTSGVVFAHLDEPLMDQKLRTHTFCHAVPGKWHVMGVVLSAGGSLRWLRDEVCGPEREAAGLLDVDPYEIMTAQAAKAPVGSEGLLFLPYLTGERTPYADPNAKGVFCGLTLRHTREYLIRAVLEGVAFSLRDSFEIIKALGLTIKQVRASGGGARSRLWRQVQADVTHEAHSTISATEGPAYGVALLAAVGTGTFKSVEEACRATIAVVDTCEPRPEASQVYDELYPVYQSLYARLKPLFDQTSELVAAWQAKERGT